MCRKFRSASRLTCSGIRSSRRRWCINPAPSTALRLSDGEKTFAYSGDTEWTDALIPIAREADLFVCECYAYAGKLTGHMTWEILQTKLAALAAKRTMLTHMNASMLARVDEARSAGVLIAEDGLELEV